MLSAIIKRRQTTRNLLVSASNRTYKLMHQFSRQRNADDNIVQFHVNILKRIFYVDVTFRTNFVRPAVDCTKPNTNQISLHTISLFFYLFIHCYITTKITIKTKAKKTENTPHAAIHKSATVRPGNHGDIHHKTML